MNYMSQKRPNVWLCVPILASRIHTYIHTYMQLVANCCRAWSEQWACISLRSLFFILVVQARLIVEYKAGNEPVCSLLTFFWWILVVQARLWELVIRPNPRCISVRRRAGSHVYTQIHVFIYSFLVWADYNSIASCSFLWQSHSWHGSRGTVTLMARVTRDSHTNGTGHEGQSH
jgi:hypothetical protein